MNFEDPKLTFDEEKHEYKYGDKIFVSVTEFLKRFFPEFDETVVAAKVAKKQGKTSEEVLEEWKAIRDEGTLVHKEIEDWIRVRNQPKHPKAIQAVKWILLNNIEYQFKRDYPEVRVCSPLFRLAGTIDYMEVSKDQYTKPRVALIDWKTNADISKQNVFETTDAEGPIAHLHSSKFNKYALQLGIYAFLLEQQYDVIVEDLCLVKLEEDRVVPMRIDYLKETVRKLLHERLNQILSKGD